MLEEHEKLLASIKGAEAEALKLHRKGCRVEEVVGYLRKAGNAIKERVRHYRKDATVAEITPPQAPPKKAKVSGASA